MISVSLRFTLFTGSLSLQRAPKYLRFVVKDVGNPTKRAWDALDQLDDQPEPDETVMAAVKWYEGQIHVDRTVDGKRVGEWYPTATYELVAESPPDEVLRSTELWRKWCYEQAAIVRDSATAAVQ